MKKIYLSLITSLLLSAFAFSQDCVFYEYKITSEKAEDNISGFLKCYNMSGNSNVESVLRMPNMPKSLTKSSNISRADKAGKVFMLLPSAKMFSEVAFAEFSDNPKTPDDYEITFLGNEMVNGYNAVHIVYKSNSYTSGKKKTEMWISKGVPGFSNYVVSKGNQFFNDEDLFNVLRKRGAEGIPVRIKTVEFGSNVVFDLEKAEKCDVAASFFEVPSDYTKASSAKLNTAQEVVEDMQDMSKEEVQALLQQLKKKYKLE